MLSQRDNYEIACCKNHFMKDISIRPNSKWRPRFNSQKRFLNIMRATSRNTNCAHKYPVYHLRKNNASI